MLLLLLADGVLLPDQAEAQLLELRKWAVVETFYGAGFFLSVSYTLVFLMVDIGLFACMMETLTGETWALAATLLLLLAA